MNNEENIKTGPYATTTRLFSLPPSAQPDELRVGCLHVEVVRREVAPGRRRAGNGARRVLVLLLSSSTSTSLYTNLAREGRVSDAPYPPG